MITKTWIIIIASQVNSTGGDIHGCETKTALQVCHWMDPLAAYGMVMNKDSYAKDLSAWVLRTMTIDRSGQFKYPDEAVQSVCFSCLCLGMVDLD